MRYTGRKHNGRHRVTQGVITKVLLTSVTSGLLLATGCQTIPESPAERNIWRQQRLAELAEEIRRAHREEMRACIENNPPGEDRAACFREAREKHERLMQEYIELLREIEDHQHEEDLEAIRRHYEAIRELIKKLPEWDDILPAIIPIKNQQPVLPQGTVIGFDIPLAPGGSTPTTIVWVDGIEIAPAAAGALMRWSAGQHGETAPPEGAVLLDSNVYELKTVGTTFVIPPGSGGSISLGGLSGNFGLSGTFTIVDRTSTGNRSAITSLDVTITMFGKKMTLTLDKSAFNSLTLSANGQGVLSFRAAVDTDDEVELLHFLPPYLWLEVPVTYNPVTGTLRLSTGGVNLPFQRILPIQWYPFSDFNGDGSLTQEDIDAFVAAWTAGDTERADLDYDGDVDVADLDLFHSCFAEDLAWSN